MHETESFRDCRLNFGNLSYITHNKNGGNITMAIRNIRTIGDEILTMNARPVKEMTPR